MGDTTEECWLATAVSACVACRGGGVIVLIGFRERSAGAQVQASLVGSIERVGSGEGRVDSVVMMLDA